MGIRLALVDDHSLFREGLRSFLSSKEGVSVVAEAGDARDAYEQIDATQPDVAVLDIGLPGIDGIAAAREIQRRAPGVKLLVLSMYRDQDRVRWSLGAGARGYVLKDDPPDTVLEAIRAVAQGEKFLSPRLEVDPGEAPPSSRKSNDALERLSPRELEIFRMIVKGESNAGISKTLCISVKTVETHRAHINKKLGARSPADLVRLAARRGLVDD
jgi:DNA-binding NarL/FixJ family response regulator